MASKIKFEIEAAVRHDKGKGASRRLRREEKVPGVVYGGGKEAVSLTIEHKKIAKALQAEAFYSHILTLKTGTESERVILKDVQRHPFKASIYHVDFQRVRSDQKLHMHVPLHFIGSDECQGAKEGGLISHIMSDVEISCLPDDLPEFIEVNVAGMALNDIIHLSQLTLPKGVEVLALSHGDDKAVVSVHIPRVEVEPEVVEEPEGAPVAPSEVPAMAQKGDDADAEGGDNKKKK
jgi:large subunit ribosomal protein L25